MKTGARYRSFSRCRSGAGGLAVEDSAAMGDLQDGDDMRVVVDLVEHAVITDANSVCARLGDDGPYAVRPGVVGELVDRGGYPFAFWSVQAG